MTASINLLPGPVHIHPLVQRAFCRPPVSHRAEVFLEDVTLTRRLLCNLVGAEEAVLVLGSGTLANDAVALQLAQHGKHIAELREFIAPYSAETVASVVGIPAAEIRQTALDFAGAIARHSRPLFLVKVLKSPGTGIGWPRARVP